MCLHGVRDIHTYSLRGTNLCNGVVIAKRRRLDAGRRRNAARVGLCDRKNVPFELQERAGVLKTPPMHDSFCQAARTTADSGESLRKLMQTSWLHICRYGYATQNMQTCTSAAYSGITTPWYVAAAAATLPTKTAAFTNPAQ